MIFLKPIFVVSTYAEQISLRAFLLKADLQAAFLNDANFALAMLGDANLTKIIANGANFERAKLNSILTYTEHYSVLQISMMPL